MYSYIYLASPYSHTDPDERTRNAMEAENVAVSLLAIDKPVFSPIVYAHPLAMLYQLGFSYDYWKTFNAAMLRGCSELWVLCMNGVGESIGVQEEIAFAQKNDKPIRFLAGRVTRDGEIPFITAKEAEEYWQINLGS